MFTPESPPFPHHHSHPLPLLLNRHTALGVTAGITCRASWALHFANGLISRQGQPISPEIDSLSLLSSLSRFCQDSPHECCHGGAQRERGKKKVGPRRAEESGKLATPPLPHPTTTTCLCLLKFEGLLIGASSLKTHLFGTFCKVLCGIMKNSGAVTGSVTSRLNHGFRQRCCVRGLRVLMLLLNVFCFLGKFFTSTTQIPNNCRSSV